MKPLVSVLMPVYNSENYVEEAIKSILTQSYSNFEFIIIDDASTDNSVQIIRSLRDERIKLITKPQNTGYTVSLNMGLAICKGKYIARMDSDDISLPLRLEKQVALMESSPEIGICGTWVETIGTITGRIKRYATIHAEIKTRMLINSHFVHPAVMIRKSVLDQYNLQYDSSFEPAEDYALWVRIGSYASFANIPEVLLKYRIHEKQVSRAFSEKQMEKCNSIRRLQITRLGIEPTADEWQLHLDLILNKDTTISKQQLAGSIAWLIKLKESNERMLVYNKTYFYKLLQHYAFLSYIKAPFTASLFKLSTQTPFSMISLSYLRQRLIYFIKNLIKQH
jgi:glycosyltransferase involved in cell wall biosynthesis